MTRVPPYRPLPPLRPHPGRSSRELPGQDRGGEPLQLSPSSQARRSGLDSSGDLVERRVADLIGMHLRRAFNHFRQTLEHLGIGVAAVLIRALLAIPQADGDGFLAIRLYEGDLVLEAVLLAEHRQNVLLERLGKLTRGVRLQIE